MQWLSLSAALVAVLGFAPPSDAAAFGPFTVDRNTGLSIRSTLSALEVCNLPPAEFHQWAEEHHLHDGTNDWSTLIQAACDSVVDRSSDKTTLKRRGRENAPSGYKPVGVRCPDDRPTIRDASNGSLSQQESDFLKFRRATSVDAYLDFIRRVSISNFDAPGYLEQHKNSSVTKDRPDDLPVIGIAVSGGGYRALFNGAGAIMAFDRRTPGSFETGRLGGLLQSSTYMSGLSGGSWLVGSLYSNNFTSVYDIKTSNDKTSNLWNMERGILEGPGGRFSNMSTVDYMTTIVDDVNAKVEGGLGYNASLTDYWGRAISYQLIDDPKGGAGFTWSSVADDESVKVGTVPMPIIVADAIESGNRKVNTDTSTVIEFNPWEMGSFNPSLGAFAPLKYIGSNFTEGKIPDGQKCMAGFDNTGFIMGTSSSLFNAVAGGYLNDTKLPSIVKDFVNILATDVARANNDVADYTPNPFKGFGNSNTKSVFSRSNQLSMIDGGSDLQNLPLDPLLHPARNVDTIIAIDSSADVLNWPNGTALIATYTRSKKNSKDGKAIAMPPIPPDANTMVNKGLNSRPTFFGCDAAASTVQLANGQSVVAPLIIYIPNSPYSAYTNTTTFKQTYTTKERDAVIDNGFNVVTMANGTVDSEWPTCLGCATLARSFARTNTSIPDVCQDCFGRYCWDGTADSSKPSAPYAPTAKLDDATPLNSAGQVSGPVRWFAVGIAVVASSLLL